jgi:hypothetical protein
MDATYKIYVVTTEIEKLNENIKRLAYGLIEEEKRKISDKFGGLTVYKNCEGYFTDESKTLCVDSVEVWEIITDAIITAQTFINYGERLKAICKQKSQMITINGRRYFV